MKKTLQIFALTIALLGTTAAHAGNDSMFSLGIGTSMGMTQQTPFAGDVESKFTTDLTVRTRLLYVLGLEFSYSPTDRDVDTQQLVFTGQYGASALLYVVPTSPVAFYLKGGIGAQDIGDLAKFDGATNSYHAGAGLDLHLGDHFVLGAEFLLLLPGIASVKNTLKNYAETELNRYRFADGDTSSAPKQPGLKDFISASNFRVGVTAHYYF